MMAANKMEFMVSAKILEDLNVFIRDTGALSDTTTSDLGLQNKKTASEADHIVDTTGKDLTGKTVRDMSGVFCDKYGTECNKVMFKDMVYSPKSEFNLFSLTKDWMQDICQAATKM